MQNKPFKIIDESLFEEIQLSFEKSFYFVDKEGNKKELNQLEATDYDFPTEFKIEDDAGDWNNETDTAYLDLKIKIKNPNALFGTSGVCYWNAVLGVGLVWKAERSKIKHCKQAGKLTHTGCPLEYELKDIPIKEITSNIPFSVVFYLSEPGVDRFHPQKCFGNEKGLILGQFNLFTIVAGGTGSTFPIKMITDPAKPLWSIEASDFEYDDPFDDEHLAIAINQAHPLYCYLDPKNEKYDEGLLKEVIGSACTLLLVQIKRLYQLQNSPSIDEDSLPTGSIHQQMKYFKEKLGINFMDEDDKIHQSLMNLLKEKSL